MSGNGLSRAFRPPVRGDCPPPPSGVLRRAVFASCGRFFALPYIVSLLTDMRTLNTFLMSLFGMSVGSYFGLTLSRR